MTRATVGILACACLLALSLATPTVADGHRAGKGQANPRAELDGAELDGAELKERRDDLRVRIEILEQQIHGLLSELEADASSALAATDDMSLALAEFSAVAREVDDAEALRLNLALHIYMYGDPRVDTVLDEILELHIRDDVARERALFSAVEENVAVELSELGQTEVVHRDAITDARRSQEQAEQSRDEGEAELREALQTKRELEADLAEVEGLLEQLEGLGIRYPLTGVPASEVPARPAIAAKIDNYERARPQSGLNQADIVYEEIVEGGITRFVALYHSREAPTVGPVRSGRTSDFDLVLNLNWPLFASSGGNRNVLSQLADQPILDVTENTRPQLYWRDDQRTAPHNLYTTTAALWSLDLEPWNTPPQLFAYRDDEPLPAGAEPVKAVELTLGSTAVTYTWSDLLQGWLRATDGVIHTDAEGHPVAPANVIVQFADYVPSPADPRSPELQSIGAGEAWVLTDGHIVPSRWTRVAGTARTTYHDAAGNEVRLTPGTTWVSFPEPGGAVFRR
ncbi:MAG: hypothetical protein DCC48_09435 [Acidobacteria bacterium]|nr:MAG: hypothetical protein DCC48_09435 [Acidobacteriota bacterium]